MGSSFYTSHNVVIARASVGRFGVCPVRFHVFPPTTDSDYAGVSLSLPNRHRNRVMYDSLSYADRSYLNERRGIHSTCI